MTAFRLSRTPETMVLAALLVLSLAGLAFMGHLVAAPKLLFGRSLSAIPPSLFPRIILAALALLSALCLVRIGLQGAQAARRASTLSHGEWRRGVVFFAIMLLYALTMVPLGFFLSSAVTVTLLGWHMGNRSWLQSALMALIAPTALYLAATRLLAVSLPELAPIELFYARVLGG